MEGGREGERARQKGEKERERRSGGGRERWMERGREEGEPVSEREMENKICHP